MDSISRYQTKTHNSPGSSLMITNYITCVTSIHRLLFLVLSSNSRERYYFKNRPGLSRIYNTVRIPVKLILWPLPIDLHDTLKRWNEIMYSDGTVGSVHAGELEHLYWSWFKSQERHFEDYFKNRLRAVPNL